MPCTPVSRIAAGLPRRPALLAALVAAVLVSLSLSQQAQAGRGMEVALQDDPVFVSQSYFQREKAFDLARKLGVTRLRINVNWARVLPPSQARSRRVPRAITYHWQLFDSAIDAAARHGIRVHLSLTGPAPAFATSNKRIGPRRPNSRLFAQFSAAAASHFKGRVDRYSIWNEPNWHSWLSPLRSSPSIYRSLYVRGYSAIKRADRGAKVLIGETAPYAQRGRAMAPVAFLRSMACVNAKFRRVRRCPKLRADGYAHHPYDFAHSPRFRRKGADNATLATLGNLTRALDRLSSRGFLRPTHGRRMPLFLTEYGYMAAGKRALSRPKRTRYLQQGFSMALRNGRVRSTLQYLLVSPPRRSPYLFFNTGLVTVGGKQLPTFVALARWYRRHRGSVKRPGRPIALRPAPSP